MPIVQMLDLSTAHVTGEDNEILNRLAAVEGPGDGFRWPLVVIGYEYGWIVSTALLNDDDAVEENLAKVRDEGLSDAFIEVLRYAHSNGCDSVRFDRDADLEPGLPTFEWPAKEQPKA